MTNEELLEKCYKLTLKACISKDKDPVELLKEAMSTAPDKYNYLSKEVRGFLKLNLDGFIELTDEEVGQLSSMCPRLSLKSQYKIRDAIDKVSNTFETSLLERTEPDLVKSLYRSLEMLNFQIIRLYGDNLSDDVITTINDISNMWMEFKDGLNS